MALLGSHAWWIPRWLDRILPQLQIEGTIEEAEAEPGKAAPMSGATPG